MTKQLFWVGLVSAGLLFPVNLMASEHPPLIWGLGAVSCSQYLREAEAGAPIRWLDWVSGYFSGLNAANNARREYLKGLSTDDMSAYLSNYCRDNPFFNFVDAVLSMQRDLERAR